MKLPAFEEGGNQSISLDGSNLIIIGSTKNKKTVIDFIKYTAENKENISMLMKETGMIPAYTYNYDEKWFNTKEEYFDNLKLQRLYADLAKDINDIKYTKNFTNTAEQVGLAVSGIILKGQDIKSTMDNLQNQAELNNK
jgi:ABC-type glycerol-3-phosphate transport system substrate-binding protein